MELGKCFSVAILAANIDASVVAPEKGIILGPPGLEDFGFLIHVALLTEEYRNCALMLLRYLLVCSNISILEHVYFRFAEVNFPCAKGEGTRRKLSFPGDAFSKLETFEWILNHILVNDQSLHDLSCSGVSITIC